MNKLVTYVDNAVAQRAVVCLPHGSEELPEEVDLPEDNCQSVSLCVAIHFVSFKKGTDCMYIYVNKHARMHLTI